MESPVLSSGLFRVRQGENERFVERWEALITWTRDNHPGMARATLSRGDSDTQQFVSFATWTSAERREAWRAAPGYRERSAACRELCDEYRAGDYTEVLVFADDAR